MMHEVTITFAVRGTEKQAAKLVDKVEDVIAASKRVAAGSGGAIVETEMTEVNE